MTNLMGNVGAVLALCSELRIKYSEKSSELGNVKKIQRQVETFLEIISSHKRGTYPDISKEVDYWFDQLLVEGLKLSGKYSEVNALPQNSPRNYRSLFQNPEAKLLWEISKFYDDPVSARRILGNHFYDTPVPLGFMIDEQEMLEKRQKTKSKSSVGILLHHIEDALGMDKRSTGSPGLRTRHLSLEERDNDVTLYGR